MFPLSNREEKDHVDPALGSSSMSDPRLLTDSTVGVTIPVKKVPLPWAVREALAAQESASE